MNTSVINLSELDPAIAQQIQALLSSASPQQEPKKRKGRKLPKVLSDEQVQQLFKGINPRYHNGVRHRAAFESMYRAGLRVSEVCNLVPADVDLSKGMLHIQDSKNGTDRNIPIGDTLINWLRRWDEIRPESDYFFCARNGGRLDERYLKHVIKRVSEKTGVYLQEGLEKRTVHTHNFRHTFATRMLEQGFNIREVQELLGHRNLSTTMIYTSVSMNHLDAKIKALG